MSIASLKESFSTIASLATKEGTIAAKEAYTRAPGVMSRYAATAREYVSQAVHGSPTRVSKPQQKRGDDDGCSNWEPPENSFTLPEKTRARSPSPSPDWQSDPAGLRAPEKVRRQGTNKLEYREKAGLEPERMGQHAYRTKAKIGTTVEREDSCYDPLGVSSEWRRAREFDEGTKRRKTRVSEDWSNKVEKDYDPNRRHPRLDVGKEGMESEALARRKAQGFEEPKYENAEEGDEGTEQDLR